MAANTVLNYMPRKSVVHDLTGTTKAGVLSAIYLRQHDHLQHWVLLG